MGRLLRTVTVATSGLLFMVAGRADAQIPGGAFTTASPATASDRSSALDIAVGPDGLALIVYFVGSDLTVTHCSNPACTAATTATLDTGDDDSASITIGADGLGLISY